MAKRSGNDNRQLKSAKRNKNDEFYTQMSDIEREVSHYWDQLRGKTILCNCDDPRVSNFFRYFYCRFCHLGIKKLIAVCYKNLNPDLFSQNKDEQAVYCIYDGKGRKDDVFPEKDFELFLRKNDWQQLKGDGDFRSEECVELLKQSDIVVTNPPFSLFREYVAQLMEYKKKFLIIGNKNAITYKEMFSLIRDNKMWMGCQSMGTDMLFDIPQESIGSLIQNSKEGSAYRIVDGIIKARTSSVWFTNLDVKKRFEELTLYKRYAPDVYPKYDNYDAIEVDKTAEIPKDYDGVMGVPISFLDKYNPNQFEILGMSASAGYNADIVGIPFLGDKDARPLLQGKNTYARVFIRKK